MQGGSGELILTLKDDRGACVHLGKGSGLSEQREQQEESLRGVKICGHIKAGG